MHNFYQVALRTRGGVSEKRLIAVMNKASDWFKLADDCWILSTSRSVEEWYDLLLPLVKPEGILFICRLDITERKGWMPKLFWDWLKTNKATMNKM